ncbi:hypothetical protein [Fodinicola acaciae]|uniref:hypothetical protein n=1 Tax=Fodinicola acaciae TaxID=2681555 RepID=UPI0013D24C72|nr:hypothetical protein [Fodinicola acaciae]
MSAPDGDREVQLDDDIDILPDQTSDDRDEGWGERYGRDSRDDRLLEERPPHW